MQTITREEALKQGLGRLTDHYKVSEEAMLRSAISDQRATGRAVTLVKTRRGIEIWIPKDEIKNSRNTDQ